MGFEVGTVRLDLKEKKSALVMETKEKNKLSLFTLRVPFDTTKQKLRAALRWILVPNMIQSLPRLFYPPGEWTLYQIARLVRTALSRFRNTKRAVSSSSKAPLFRNE